MANRNFTPPEVVSVLNVVDTFLRWDNKRRNSNRQYFYLHPSEFGKCARKTQYKRYVAMGFLQMEEQDLDSQKIRLFQKGHNMHHRWMSYWESIGVLRGVWECANPMCHFFDDNGSPIKGLKRDTMDGLLKDNKRRIYGRENLLGILKPEKCVCGSSHFNYHEIEVRDDTLQFEGHVDQILDFSTFDPTKFGDTRVTFNIDNLPKTPIVVDMKTCNSRKFKTLANDGPDMDYITQLTIYLNMLNCEFALLIYENKDNSEVLAFKIEKNIDLFSKITEQANKMNGMIDKKQLPPPKPDRKASYECTYCEFSSLCHKSKIWKDPDLASKRISFYG